jgi:hypothetical protein
VWTPKRIFLLAGGFVAFTLVYVLYTLTALGRINTLPPLPDQYKPSEGNDPSPLVRTSRPIMPTLLERKLEMAFGPGCEELTWPVRLELNAKSMVIAAWKFELADRGRVKLELMSLALFGKKKNDGHEIEINTLKCQQAYITFDRPVTVLTPSELNGRKVVEAELFGDSRRYIRITNNRRTTARDDDLVVRINTGPLYYIEKTQIIKTSDYVHLTDGDLVYKEGRRISPKAVVDAKGMEMELATAAPPPRPGFVPHKPKNESITGVKRIILKEAVNMDLIVTSGAPFPSNNKAERRAGNGSDGKAAVVASVSGSSAPRSSEPAYINIKTPGRFEYEIFKDHDQARFDVPASNDLPTSPQDVTVTRLNMQNGKEMYDMLVCKHLEVRLKRRNNEAPAARDAGPSEQGLEIETAHATGPDVTLTSDAEKLDAHGNDFFHDAAKKLTILKGTPYIEATKEDSLIQAPELRIQDIPLPASSSPIAGAGGKKEGPPPKTYQQIEASGPGCIHMTNKTTGQQNVHAYWKEKLLSTRDGELDLLTLIGSARFVDDEHKQALQAETLKVWLLAEGKQTQVVAVKNAAPAALQSTTSSAMPGSSRRPHRVEALRNVLAHSPELNIHDAARLVIHFRDVPPERMPPPSSANSKPGVRPPDKKPSVADPPPDVRSPRSETNKSSSEPRPSGNGNANNSPTVAAPNQQTGNTNNSSTVAAPNQQTGNTNNSSTVTAPNQQPQQARPIDLSARSIEAKVVRCNERMALDHLWAEGGALDAIDKRGGVQVRQEPAKPGEEGVYIEGNTLDMSCFPGGNVLVVTGDLAQLKMDKIFILGPEVNIDQVDNKAWVVGGGAMQMHNTTTLEGKPLAHPVPLTIHWSDNMLFYGMFAEFYGSIQAEQDQARLACQHLQVMFDRPISLKEGMRGTQPAKMSKLVADKGIEDKPVRIEDQTFEGGRLQKYQLLLGSTVQMNTVPREEDADRREAGPTSSRKNNDANEMRLSGPGSVRILQRGGIEAVPTPGQLAPSQSPPGKTTDKEQEMKLTYVRFENLMQASTLTNVASFWGAVRVLNLPCDDPHRDIDLDAMLSTELPEGALYLRCNRLRVRTYQKLTYTGTGPRQLRTYQEMDAVGQVYVQGKDFTAQCDHMTFNEEKDQVIFDGEGDNLAVMSKGDIKGGERKNMKAKRFIYIRSTGQVIARDIGSIDGR